MPARGFESLILLYNYRGMEQSGSSSAHNPKVAGSNPAPAIELNIGLMV